ncbi:hypothetical protein CAP39_04975 [Sphingomonas sp. IBVSS1]|nr:hypothetical protein CAP39_04975 [Sphingomonas sp. IBVSS1]
MSRLAVILRLAVRDLVDEWPNAACLVVVVAAAAAPLLLLLAIRDGVVGQMRAELTRFPASRELVSIGQPRVTWPMIVGLQRRPEVDFVVPRTRLLAASAVIEAPFGRSAVDLVPTGPGDPLINRPKGDGIVLSDQAARIIRARSGQTVTLIISRTRPNGERQTVQLPTRVSAILPPGQSSRQIVLLDAQYLVATEIYREDETVADFDAALTLAKATFKTRVYSGLRIYARSVDDLAAVRTMLLALGIETDSRLEEARLVQRLDQSLGTIIALLATVAASGLAVSLAAAQWGWVERRRSDLGYLRLIGLDRSELMLLPLFIGLIVTIVGMGIATGLGVLGHLAVNSLFAGMLGGLATISALSPGHVARVGLLAGVASLLASILGSLAARRIGPAVALREQTR